MRRHKPMDGAERIVGVDPGGTTGLVLLEGGKLTDSAVTESKQYLGLVGWVHMRRPTVIVAEDFRGGHGAVNLEPLEVLGVLRYYSQLACIPLVIQSPSILKAMRTRYADELTTGRHMKEAHAHALHYWLTQQG